MTEKRQPAGIPVGGQFAPEAHSEPAVTLAACDRGDLAPVFDMGPEQVKAWVAGQASHHLSPVIGWIRRDAAKGKDTSAHIASFHERARRLADDVAERFSSVPEGLQQRADATNVASEAIYTHLKPFFNDLTAASDDDSRLTATRWRVGAEAAAEAIAKKVTAPAPVLDGFTAAEVEDYLAREQHDRQCGCDLKNDICYTPSYGEHWRHRLGVPDVEGIFDTIQEMAAARKASATTEGES